MRAATRDPRLPAGLFHARARLAIRDARLQGALDLATGRLLGGRAGALASLSDADRLRDHARRIRAHTLRSLDRYLARFADAVKTRGGHVHVASTAGEARRIVTELARVRGVRTIVKSKSMVSEEVDLNAALEAAGLRVVETDLGEFVVQLAGDHPSHIIAPIIHKTRHEVAALFRDKLGATPEEVADVAAMTAFARRVLREAFLEADMGVSGVNFGVADTGTLCLVTNEGNGRLTTTTPRVHVALMGIERIVPTLDDLAVMLQILARSATGQKLSVYTSLVTGPRAPGEPDGPEELHVVLVDNGRTRLLGGELAEILFCIRCGACLNVCPVYREIGGLAYDSVYSGPVGSVVSPGLFGVERYGDLPHASSLCGACRDVCPVRIDLPRLLLALRRDTVRAGQPPAWLRIGMKMYAAAATRPWLYRLAARAARTLVRWRADEGWVRRLPGPLAAWTASRDFPAPAPRSFLERWKKR